MPRQWILPTVFFTVFLIYIQINELCAQEHQNRFEAFIITLQDDTIHGTVKEFFPGATSFEAISFWDLDGEKTKYKPEMLKGFYSQEKFFESVKLNESSRPVIYTTILLNRQIDGPMILYRYKTVKSRPNLVDGLNTKCIVYYYIRKINDEYAIRAYKRNCDSSVLQMLSQPKNNEQFLDYFREVPALYEKLKKQEIGREDIPKIVNYYNKAIAYKNSFKED